MDKPNNAPLPALRSEDDPPRHQDDALAYADDHAGLARRKATARGPLPASDEVALDRDDALRADVPPVACAECHRTITPHERREADGGAQLHAIGCAAEWFRRLRDLARADADNARKGLDGACARASRYLEELRLLENGDNNAAKWESLAKTWIVKEGETRRQRDEAEAALEALMDVWTADREEQREAWSKARALLVRRGKMTEGK